WSPKVPQICRADGCREDLYHSRTVPPGREDLGGREGARDRESAEFICTFDGGDVQRGRKNEAGAGIDGRTRLVGSENSTGPDDQLVAPLFACFFYGV